MSTAIETFREWLPVAKEIATIAAAIGALLYFGYKIFAGWLLLNLSPKIELARGSVPGDKDRLVIKICLTKGKVDAVRLLHAELQITYIYPPEMETIRHKVSGIIRLVYDPGPTFVNWDRQDSDNPYLNIAPEETIEYAECIMVEPNSVVRVELVVVGDRFRDRYIPSLSQWRTTAISIPPPPTPSKNSA